MWLTLANLDDNEAEARPLVTHKVPARSRIQVSPGALQGPYHCETVGTNSRRKQAQP
jgi:hypothetical protein